MKVKTEWWSNDGAFGIWLRIFSQRQRETNLLQHADNGIAQRFSKSRLRTGRELNPDPSRLRISSALVSLRPPCLAHTHARTHTHTHTHARCNALGERGSTHTIIASTFLRLKELLSSLSASHTIDKWTAPKFPALKSHYLKRPLITRRALKETSANGPATDTTWIPWSLTHNSMIFINKEILLRALKFHRCTHKVTSWPSDYLPLRFTFQRKRFSFPRFGQNKDSNSHKLYKVLQKTINNNHCCY